MAKYAVTETPEGDLILDIAGTKRRVVARREIPGQACQPIVVEGTIVTDGLLAGRIQISAIKYRWPDGYEKWGPYRGSIHEGENEV